MANDAIYPICSAVFQCVEYGQLNYESKTFYFSFSVSRANTAYTNASPLIAVEPLNT
jgi:hypothetical protein